MLRISAISTMETVSDVLRTPHAPASLACVYDFNEEDDGT